MAFGAATRQDSERDVAASVASIRPPALCRDAFDIDYRIHGQSIEIFATRPDIQQHYPIAQATYIRKRDVWRVYWRKRDPKWHGTTRLPEASDPARMLIAEYRENALELPESRTIICYCGTGNQATQAAAKLRKLGYDNGHALRGGISSWESEGLPLTAK